MKGLSNIIAVLGLIAIASIAVAIGFSIITNYLSQSMKPSYEISVSYAKLVFITDSENIGGTTYTTFKGEIGISNPGPQKTLKICIVSAYTSGSRLTVTTFTDTQACPTITVESGYNVYSFLIRIKNTYMDNIGCPPAERKVCPISYDWHIVVLDENDVPITIIKPVYIIP